MLLSCSHCTGFVPPNLSACPHCGAESLDVKTTSKTGSLVKHLANIATGGLVAVTLMACYGGPPDAFPADNDGDGSSFDDCNDFDSTINPRANDPLGDGIDQNCDGVDGNGGGGSGGNGSSSSGSGGSGGSAPCTTCSDAVTSTGLSNPVLPFCTPEGEKAFNDLKECACTTGCSNTCADNVCMGLGATTDCSACIQDSCATPNLDCANN
jgi:Putative metal-binding motif